MTMSDTMSDTKGQSPGAREPLIEKILADCPRLGVKDTFHFACHPGVSCFNRCCADVNIFLSPYDVLRMKKRLGMNSTEFLKKYALLPVHKTMKTPAVLLKMNDDEARTCPFLTSAACGIYEDRPWPCRMYPLGLAAQKDTADGWRGEQFYFLLKEDICRGLAEPRQWTVEQWLEGQGINDYDQWGEAFKELTLHKFFETGGELPPAKVHMLFTACYDLDSFRRFVFESTLLERFEVDEDLIERMKSDDEALLGFAYLWVRFSLFGERTMKARPEAVAAVKGRVQRKAASDQEQEEPAIPERGAP
jgi:Fe-S-cluster containining protein